MRIRENEIIPRWYGVAWRDFWMGEAVVLPIGLHWFAGVGRRASGWSSSAATVVNLPSSEKCGRTYRRGYEQGRADGVADELLGLKRYATSLYRREQP